MPVQLPKKHCVVLFPFSIYPSLNIGDLNQKIKIREGKRERDIEIVSVRERVRVCERER